MVYTVGRKANSTPTAKHFNSSRPISEEFYDKQAVNRRPKRRPLARLSFGVISPKEDRSIRNLFDLIESGPLECQSIFPDAGFFMKPMPAQFWEIGRGRLIGFSEMSVGELSGWLNYPIHNSYLHEWLPRALRNIGQQTASPGLLGRKTQVLGSVGHKLIPYTVGVANKAALNAFGYDYYVGMLSLRKKLGIAESRKLRTDLGREPTEQEMRNHLHNKFHPRIAPIAFKGWKDQGKRNFLADEELVVTAVLTAVVGCSDNLILTWDTDVFDQFTKLAELMSADYACFRWAEVHAQSPDGCPMFPMAIPADGSGCQDAFAGNELHHIVISSSDVEQLPPSVFYTPVQVYCVLLGNNCIDPKMSTAAFCFEAEMAEMLRVKSVTGGKNTSRFPGRNMIVGTDLREGQMPGTLFSLAAENMLTYEGITVSWLDLQNALKCDPLIVRKHYLN